MTIPKTKFSKRRIAMLTATCIIMVMSVTSIISCSSKPITDTSQANDAGKLTSETNPNVTGLSADSAPITAEKAKEIALSHAGIAAADTTLIRAELDRDDGRQVYEVEFYSGNTEYDYDIDSTTGEVVSVDKDIENYMIPDGNQSLNGDAGITAEKAKEIALSHAGITAADATLIKAELDRDDGKQEYDVEFNHGRTEYHYEIDAATGEIISFESEMKN